MLQSLFRHERWLVLVTAVLVGGAYAAGFLAPLASLLADQRFRVAQREASGKVLLVDIDAKSLAEIGTWPWPRSLHGQITDQLSKAGAGIIGFDVDFSSSSNPEDDGAFAQALERAGGGVFLAAFRQKLTQAADENRVTSNLPITPFIAHSWPAVVNVTGDARGVIRSVPLSETLEGEVVPAMAGVLVGTAQALSGNLLIDFSIRPEGLDRVSAVDLLRGRVPADRIKGRAVLVGAAALELRDIYQVPIHGLMSGPMIQALATETLIQGRALRWSGDVTTFAGLGLILLLCSFVLGRLPWQMIIGGLLAAALLTEAAAAAIQAAFALVVDTSAWQVAFAGFVAALLVREIRLRRLLITGSRDQMRNTRAILDQVVADNFAGVLVSDEDGVVRAMSRRAAEILGSDDLTGRLLREGVPAAVAEPVEHALAEARLGGLVAYSGRELAHTTERGTRRLEYAVTVSRLGLETQSDGSARDGSLIACLTFQDVTEERTAQDRLAFLARNDVLTGLPNRHEFAERLDCDLQTSSSGVAILFFDLDRFKTINDTLGHTLGDILLRAVASRLAEITAPGDMASRFGGDEFAMLVTGLARDEVLALAERLVETVSAAYQLDGHRLVVGASVGCALAGPGSTAATLLKNADTALYRAKAAGGNCVVLFDESMDAGLRERQAMEIDLWRAFDEKQFELVYQPQVNLTSGEMCGVETLIRWKCPKRGYVSPAEFIPIAEAVGLIEQLGRWILFEACTEVARWPGCIKVSVNVSPAQFVRGNLVNDVLQALEASGFPPERLDLEITESLFIHEHGPIERAMTELKSRGISFSIDDFGTGYSSLSYIRMFPVDKIKIDKSFVDGLPTSQDSIAIVSAVMGMASSMGLRVNAEGVETQEQADALRLMGCHEVQGWLFGKPKPAADIIAALNAERQTVAA
jgi:diguanylate cyclase (GGDEF)-like protein